MLTDRFCPSQLPEGFDGPVHFRPASKAEARAILAAAGSAIENPHLRRLIEADLGVRLGTKQEAPALHIEDQMVVARYIGPGIKTGQVHLDPTARFDYFLIDVGCPQGWRHRKS